MNEMMPLAVVLSSREEAVYALVTGSRRGVTASEAGRVAHSVPGPRGGKTHPADQPCDYCLAEGNRLCAKLVKIGLLKRTRPGDGSGYLYVLANSAGPNAADVEWSQNDDIPY